MVYLRPNIGVRRHGRSALVFPVLPGQLMRGADEKIRVSFAQDFTHADLVLRCPIGMKKQNCDGFESLFLNNARHFARRLFIERRADRAVGEHPLGDLEDIFAGHQRAVLAKAQIERFRAIDPSDLIDIAKALRRDKRGRGALALNNRI